jgi:hypothetical protein
MELVIIEEIGEWRPKIINGMMSDIKLMLPLMIENMELLDLIKLDQDGR